MSVASKFRCGRRIAESAPQQLGIAAGFFVGPRAQDFAKVLWALQNFAGPRDGGIPGYLQVLLSDFGSADNVAK
jgi:hypothetical protein